MSITSRILIIFSWISLQGEINYDNSIYKRISPCTENKHLVQMSITRRMLDTFIWNVIIMFLIQFLIFSKKFVMEFGGKLLILKGKNSK